MKKIPLLITLGIILLLASGYFIFTKLLTHHPTQAWDLVPENAIAVFERDQCTTCAEDLEKSTVHKLLEAALLYGKPADSIHHALQQSFRERTNYLISLHVTKKDDFDFVYYLPKGDQALVASFLNNRLYKHTSRTFSNIVIHELKFSGQSFSFAVIDDIWTGSFTPFLVEDVIRTFRSEGVNFKKNSAASLFTSIRDDAGNIHVHLKNLGALMNVFTIDKTWTNYSLGKSAVLDVKTRGNSLVLNGFSTDSTQQSNHLLSIFRHQSPVNFSLKRLITNRALAVSSFGVSDGSLFYKDLQTFAFRNNKHLADTLRQLSNSHHFNLESLYTHIHDEFGVCFVESSKGSRVAKILFIETDKPETWLKTFDNIADKLSVDTVFYEKYSQFEIREVPLYKFPEKLLWPFVQGFEQSFYTTVGNVILVGDNLEELKSFLDDIEAEDTWGKSVAQNKFLETTLLESNLSLYVNPARALTVLQKKLQPRWQHFISDQQPLTRSLQMSSLQFSHLNNSYYTNALFTYRPADAVNNRRENREKLVVNFDRGISGIYPVKSHVNRSQEILVQDSLNDLILLSAEGKELWKIPVGDKIISDVSQIDFFNNGKLQYFFSTAHDVHILDRLGHYVEPFPMHLSPEIDHISIVDYDNSKRYRILVADKKGSLWMYDKEGKNLEGWSPKETGGPLAMAARHHRIKGKDYILAVRKDGKVFLMTRRGETLRNFPVDIEGVPVGDYFLETGSTIRDTYYVIVTREGYKTRLTVEGKIQNRETLLKNSIHSVFSLVRELSDKSYLILEQDGKQLSLYDEAGKKIVSNDFGSIPYSYIHYYYFGTDKRFVTMTDPSQGLSYIYDGQGELLTIPPLEGSALEISQISQDQFKVYLVSGRSLVIQPLP